MSHEGHTAALRRATEEGNFDLPLAQLVRKVKGALPGCLAAGLLVVLERGEVGSKAGIRLDETAECYLKKRHKRGAEIPGVLSVLVTGSVPLGVRDALA